jgi:uncharacterized protein
MHPRASFLIESLGLRAHPEGGFFREVFRSASIVTSKTTDSQRAALTSIYYLLPAGQVSKFHRVISDEVWHFLEGDPLELYVIDPSLTSLHTHLLGPASGDAQPIFTVPANHWQAARPKREFTLSGCAVGPGFEYEDFRLLSEQRSLALTVKEKFPHVATLV